MTAIFKKKGLLLFVVLISACNWGKTPSAIKFAKICGIESPTSGKVIRDEFHRIGSRYMFYYKVKLTQPQMAAFLNKVKQSGHFHVLPANENGLTLLSKMFKEGGWYKSGNVYRFMKGDSKASFSAVADTSRSKIEFWEFGH